MSADRRLISSGSPFEKQAGYSRAVAVGPWCFVAGTTGYDYATMSLPESVEAQTENVFATIERALGEAGFAMSDLVRVSYIVSDRAYQDAVFAVSGRLLGAIRPAATMIVAGLIRPEIKIEIEATAYRP